MGIRAVFSQQREKRRAGWRAGEAGRGGAGRGGGKPLRRHSNESRAEKSGSGGIPRAAFPWRGFAPRPRVPFHCFFSASLRSQGKGIFARVIFRIPDTRAFRASSRAIPRFEARMLRFHVSILVDPVR